MHLNISLSELVAKKKVLIWNPNCQTDGTNIYRIEDN